MKIASIFDIVNWAPAPDQPPPELPAAGRAGLTLKIYPAAEQLASSAV